MRLVLCSLLLLLAAPAQAALPAWALDYNRLDAALSRDPCVTIDDPVEPETADEVPQAVIRICRPEKAAALAALLEERDDLAIRPLVIGVEWRRGDEAPTPQGDVETRLRETAAVIDAALDGNPYYVATHVGELFPWIAVEFRPVVIQYYDDNVFDPYLMTSVVAAQLFREVLGLDRLSDGEILVSVTSSPIGTR